MSFSTLIRNTHILTPSGNFLEGDVGIPGGDYYGRGYYNRSFGFP